MNALYSLYDALISINVPTDRAKAVVEAMEREMAAILATKDDVALLRQEAKSDINLLRQETSSEFKQLRQEMAGEFKQLRQEMAGEFKQLRQEAASESAQLRQELKGDIALLAKDIRMLDDKFEQKMALLRSSMMVWLGSIQVVGLGLLFAALKLT